MARGSEMQQVELDDASGEVAAEPPSSPTRRRWRRWLLGIAVVVVTGLLAGQAVADRREDAAVARLRALPGVTGPVDAHLTARPAGEKTIRELAGAGGADVAADGSQSLTWQPDGGTRWTVDLTGPSSALAVDEARGGSRCRTDAQPGGRFVVCYVTDGGWVPTSADDDGSYSDVPSTRDEVVVLAASDGAVVARWQVARQATLAVVDDVVAVGALVGKEPVVMGYAIATGTRRWEYRPRGVAYQADLQDPVLYVNRAGRFVVVQGAGVSVELLRSDGTEVRTIGDVDAAEGSGYVSCEDGPTDGVLCTSGDGTGSERLVLLGDDADPAQDRRLTGGLVPASVDDGSLPGLLLTYDGSLRAWDAASGRPRWHVGEGAVGHGYDSDRPYDALVMRGLVYYVDQGTPVAIDGRTGERRWTGESAPGEMATGLLTDGRHVMATYEPGGGTSSLVAFDARSGERLFRAPYPTGVDHLQVMDHQLVGYPDQDEGSPEFSLVS